MNLPAAARRARGGLLLQPADGRPATDFSSVEQAHRALVEQVVEVDAAFVERYLNDGDVDPAGAARAAGAGAARRPPDPDLFRLGAHRRRRARAAGRDRAAAARSDREAIRRRSSRARARRRKPLQAEPDPTRHVLAHVFKITQDPYVGKMGVLRVHQGTLTRGQPAVRGRRAGALSRWATCFVLQGKEFTEVPRAMPGDLCAIAKVEELHFDAVLHDAAEDDHIHLQAAGFPGAGARPGDRAQAARRRAAAARHPAKAGERGPVPAAGTRGGHQRDAWSTAWASCTCAPCWIA